MLRSTTYIDVFNQSVTNYIAQQPRPGYVPTLFTKFRHAGEKYPALVEFEQALLHEENIASQKETIERWLRDPRLKSNHHSFRAYLIDALVQAFPDDEWEKFDNTRLVFYHLDGFLYRGSLQRPDDAFQNGMQSGFQSGDIEAFAEAANYNAGVSTSKSAKVAECYTSHLKIDHYGVHEFTGFLYQIHYRGNAGIDIDATHRQRGHRVPTTGTKQEVNIVTDIPKEDIVGYGYVNQDGLYVEVKRNPHYQPDKMPMPILNKQAQLASIFPEDPRSTCTIL